MIETTADRFLGGRLIVRQPTKGFRAGLDAVMLAAAVSVSNGEHVLELGAGCGVASLCLAARVSGCAISGLEIDRELVEMASDNARTNFLDGRVSFFEGDAFDPPRSLRREFAHVFANPPFHLADGVRSPERLRSSAKHGED